MNTQFRSNQNYQNVAPRMPVRSGVFRKQKAVEVNGERATETITVLGNALITRAADMEKMSASRGPYRSARVEVGEDRRVVNVIAYGPLRNQLARLPYGSTASFEGHLNFSQGAAFFNVSSISTAPLHITDPVQEPAAGAYSNSADPTNL